MEMSITEIIEEQDKKIANLEERAKDLEGKALEGYTITIDGRDVAKVVSEAIREEFKKIEVEACK